MYHNIAIGLIIVLLFISLITVFCIQLIRLYLRKIKEHNLKELDFQKTLNETIIETQEQVLNNISQDLHDDAGQQLTYINFQIENLKLDSPELQEVLDPLSQSVRQLSQSIRNISHALNNQLLMQQDLIKAMATEAKRLQKIKKVAVTYSFKENAKKHFSINEKIFIYRIFQECLNNSFKHAKAGKISIKITTSPVFEMMIMDDGKGFDCAKEPAKKSLGLSNMRARAHSIGYHLDIHSDLGEGTMITLRENKNTP